MNRTNHRDFKTREFEAADLRKAGNFQAALNIYRDLWKEHEGQFNEWATWSYGKCAQKCDQHDEAERIARICYERWPECDQGRQLLAWCHYYRHFQNAPPKGQPVSRAYWLAAEEVVALCADDPHSKYAPCVRVVFVVVKTLEDRPNTGENVQKRLDWLDHLDPSLLDGKAESFTGADGKQYVQASDRENWYSLMSKALLDGKRYEECIALCEEALSKFSKLHYDNDIWFGMRIAKAKAGLGRTEEAIEDYKRLVAKKPEWFLYYDLALLSHKLGQGDDALRYGAESALAPGPQANLPYRWQLFLFLAIVLKKDGREDLARQHAHLAASLRNQENWKIEGSLLKRFEELGVDPGEPCSTTDLVRDLRKHWKEWTAAALPRHEGSIDWVHHEKPFGFIKADGLADSVYFKVHSFKGPKERLGGGTRVTFLLKESYDPKKDEMSNRAVEIEPLD